MPALELNPNKPGIGLRHDPKTRLMTFKVRGVFNGRVAGDVFLTPFEVVHMELSFAVHKVVL